jgi:hypothetical protein
MEHMKLAPSQGGEIFISRRTRVFNSCINFKRRMLKVGATMARLPRNQKRGRSETMQSDDYFRDAFAPCLENE